MAEGKKKAKSRARPDEEQRNRQVSTPSPPAVGNSIVFGDGKPEAGGGSLRVERAEPPEKDRRSRKSPPAKVSAHPVPDTVRERFIQIGNNFYFPDGADAFSDHGNRVSTRSENAIVIQSMVAIAKERDAKSVTVTGTDFFKKEAWFAARLVGLDVTGYTPTALEQERLVRAIARRRSPEDESRAAEMTERQNQKPAESPPKPAERGELLVGRLVDHGPAPYQHQPAQGMSYYVRIETERGDREIWGVDLERAVRQSLSTPGVGDEVGLRSVGRDPVTVIAPKYDASGQEVGREERGAHRNQWILETKEFLDRRFRMADTFRNTTVSASEAVREFPELEGSYLQLQLARAGVEQRIQSAAAREQFVDHVRSHLAKTIEYGQPLEPMHLKARAEIPRERAPELDFAPQL
jgi:conjugative element/phage-associated large polyvalent protein